MIFMVPTNNRLGSSYSDKFPNPDIGNMVPLGLPLLQDGHVSGSPTFRLRSCTIVTAPFATAHLSLISYIFLVVTPHL